MAKNDPFARLEAGLAQPAPKMQEPPNDEKIIQREEEQFAELFDAVRKFDTILQRHGDWTAKFLWLNVDSNRIAYGRINISKGGHIVREVPLHFQGKGVWFADPEFKAITHRDKEHGNWHTGEIGEIKSALSTYIQHVVQEHG